MSRPCIVVGGGPAGLAAAIEAARAGVAVTLFEEGPILAARASRAQRERLTAEARTVESRLEVHLETPVLAVTDRREVLWRTGDSTATTSAETLILATGARDKLALFPGWTLPGVGRADAGGIPAGARVLLAGFDPGLLTAHRRLREAGCLAVAIVSPGARPRLAHGRPQTVWAAQAAEEWETIQSSGVPIHEGHLLVEAQGSSRVERAAFAPIDPDTRTARIEASRSAEVDFIALSYGRVPEMSLCRSMEPFGDSPTIIGEGIPRTNCHGECFGMPGSFAAGGVMEGFCRGIAEESGRSAGITIAERLGALNGPTADACRGPWEDRIKRDGSPGGILQSFDCHPCGFRLPALIDETLVCPCEDVTVAGLRAAVDAGLTDLGEIKCLTRLGMGACQGRDCGPLCKVFVGDRIPEARNSWHSLSRRPPARLVTLGALAHMRDEP